MRPLSRSEGRAIRALRKRKGREVEGRFLAEGVRVVEELLDSGLSIRLAVVSPSLEATDRGRSLAARLARATEVRTVGDGELGGLADTESPQGVVVVAERPVRDLGSLAPGSRSVVLVLDGVQDPGNLGTLARSAWAFGADALVGLPGTVDPWNPKAVRAAAGALFRMPVVLTGRDALVGWADRHGYRLVSAAADGAPLSDRAPAPRVAVVLGNEGAGVSPEVEARCAGRLAVPMRRGAESLNVAVAGSILLYELTKELG